jgi:hypothetical protein
MNQFVILQIRTIIMNSIVTLAILSLTPEAFAQEDSTGGNETAPSGIDWHTLCTDVSQMNVLLQPCSDLVNSNGTLTPAGNTAMGCIRSVLSLGLGALHQGVPLGRAIFGLGLLVQPAGCGDTINMNTIESPNQFKFLTQAFSLH